MKLSAARFQTNKRRCLVTARAVKLWSSFLGTLRKQKMLQKFKDRSSWKQNLLSIFKHVVVASNSGSSQATNG